MTIPPGQVVRLTEEEVIHHPLYKNFSGAAARHPPLRGWLATSICGERSHVYGLLQLSDKSDGRDFDATDARNLLELSALIGQTLDALRAAASSP